MRIIIIERCLNILVFNGTIFYDLLFTVKGDYKEGVRRLSHKAFKGALRISLLRDEPGYCLPYKVMTLLTDVDGLMMKWRRELSL